jgi:hypothetical protein
LKFISGKRVQLLIINAKSAKVSRARVEAIFFGEQAMKKPPFYVTDPRHFLDENGLVPDNLPTAARKLIAFLGQVIEEASTWSNGGVIETTLKCMRRPGRKPCPGKIVAEREGPESPILWKCTSCGTGGQLHNWKGTQWDNSMESVH